MRNLRGTVLFAWVLCVGVILMALFSTVNFAVSNWTTGLSREQASQVIFGLMPALFAIPATLIITRQPRNVIGWLLMTLPLISIVVEIMQRYLEGFRAAPPPANIFTFMMIVLVDISWLALIMPLLLIPLFFPTGRLLSPRWRWVVCLAIGMSAFLFLWAMALKTFQPEFASWTLQNPLGFLPKEADLYFMTPWSILLMVLTMASLASIFIRYRRAAVVEREQIKWLLYACAIFGLVFIPSLFLAIEDTPGRLGTLLDVVFALVVAFVPASITIAILRYHLFDIDIVIRLTLIYASVSALLGLAFAGGIILIQAGFRSVTGQTSDFAILVTTLATASLANPLRRRIQAVIDRRFFRQKYNVDHALEEFANAARSGSDLDSLTGMLIELVVKTLQPTQVNLLLKPGDGKVKASGESHPGA
jgi:hypothetical protein